VRRSRPTSIRRVAATIVAIVVLPILLTQPASAGATNTAATTTDRGKAAAGWLASRFTNGTHLRSCYRGQCFPDYGLTADAVIGMASSHSAGRAIDRAERWLAANAPGYIGAKDGTGPYPGAYAKLALTAEVTGRSPAAFGGIDLLAALRAQQCPHVGCTAGSSGDFRNSLADGGFPNVITQSLAIVALSRSGRAADRAAVPAAVSFLRRQQCSPTTGYSTVFRAGGSCTAEVDATAFAVQALLAAGGTPDRAIGWLARQQQRDGGFVSNGTENANSTGLAIQALAAAGRRTGAAQRYLAGLQLGCAAARAAQGAISYDGVRNYQVATALRATPQGMLGFTRVPLARITAAGAHPAALRLACG